MNERIYQHSVITQVFVIGLILLMLGGVCFGLGFGLQTFWLMVPFMLLLGFLFISTVFAYTAKAIISEEEITTRSLLGSKTLRWTEIARVSGRGYGIKLHNFDEDTTVSPSVQLPGYEEIVEWIGRKRPDLFGAQEFSEMRRGILQIFGSSIATLAIIGLMGLFLWSSDAGSSISIDIILPLIFLGIIILSILGSLFSAPHAVIMEGGMLRLRYLLSEKTMLANEIVSIQYAFTRTRNGKRYYIAVHTADKKTIRISGLNVGLPIAYLALKNWHARNT